MIFHTTHCEQESPTSLPTIQIHIMWEARERSITIWARIYLCRKRSGFLILNPARALGEANYKSERYLTISF